MWEKWGIGGGLEMEGKGKEREGITVLESNVTHFVGHFNIEIHICCSTSVSLQIQFMAVSIH